MGFRISDLPAAAGSNVGMQFEVNNAGTSERLTLAQMFALSTGAVIVDAPLLNFAQTWDNAAVAFTALKLNVTDTASAAGAKLLDLQVGGVSKFAVSKAGGISIDANGGVNASNAATLFLTPQPGWPVYINSGGGLQLPAGAPIQWGAAQAFLYFDANDTLAQRNSTNEQVFRIYGTYIDASNNNYLQVAHQESIGYCSLFSKANGSANLRPLRFGIGNTSVFQITTAGHLEWLNDNTHDIGANSANRPRNIYLAGDIYVGAFARSTYVLLSGESLLASGGAGIVRVGNVADNDFNRLQFGGTTSSFPALKRSGTGLQVRLADDSAYAEIRGKLATHAAAATETITPDKTLTLYDSAGTAYKVPCVAA